MTTNYKQKIAELIKADNYPEAFIYCGYALRENQNDQEVQQIAAFIFKRINDAHVELKPETSEDYLHRGIANFYAGEIEASIYDYSMAIELDESNDYAFKSRHISNATLGKINESLKDIVRAIEINPTNAWYRMDLANLLSLLPDKKNEALSNYLKSVELEPTSEILWYNFGVELQAQGYIQDAILKYTKAIEINPNYEDAVWNYNYCKGLLGSK